MTKDTDSGNAGHTGDMATPKPTRPRISTPKSAGTHNQIRLGGSGLKHPDRESYPDLETLAGLVRLTKIIVRAQVFDLIGVEDELRKKFLGRSDAAAAVKSFTDYGIMIDDGGRFQLS